ncbi:hypothetical protein [Catellatospora sp. TT07R-123]|uniref:hypothetical protein n=1 Tax=Catellatospora sp. TT07R-123 TaxID=2733863 RepID=UPI001BB405FF|nr:hypothetical protein [Catellatospora sp. TT07R-123]
MRRILAAATLGVALFGAAACADTPVDTPAASGAPSAAASPTPAGVDKKTACENLTKADADFKAKIMPLLPKLMDPATAGEAVQGMVKELPAFQAAYGKDAETIADAELKAAVQADLAGLNKALADVAAAGADQAKIQAIVTGPEFSSLGEKVQTLCKA